MYGGEKYYEAWAQTPASLSGVFSEHPVWMLGMCYRSLDGACEEEKWSHMLQDFETRIWLTYRKEFPKIDTYVTDAGWGCMIRTGQMLLAQGLMCHYLGRDWRRNESAGVPAKYGEILRMFLDTPKSIYSIHNIVATGYQFDKRAGEWYGPGSIAQVLQALFLRHNVDDSITVHVSNDQVIYRDRIQNKCEVSEDEWKSVIILLPLRLGLERVNDIYLPSLRKMFEFPQSLGFIGGKPAAAHYFVGAQDSNVLYLDPHVVRVAITDPDAPFASSSYHCKVPRKMKIADLDPSLAAGFYCQTKGEFEDLCDRIAALNEDGTPFFSVADKEPSYDTDAAVGMERGPSSGVPAFGSDDEEDDFEML
eukprot:GFYU01002054.1.p1 GENE.GFYU01002054.1~~GFYU01002054.1.p1  ORF type:complete len:363 (-),score=59.06 GFYU01002054.1:26-1114(-)